MSWTAKYFRPLVATIGAIAWLSCPAYAADILDELKAGQHFERTHLSGTGPEVLRDALAGKANMVSALSLYFSNGERGFPRDVETAHRLDMKAYDMGHWLSGMQLAKRAQENKDYKKALKLYMIVFVSAADENKRRDRQRLFYLNEPSVTHHAYAAFQHILLSGWVTSADSRQIETEAIDEAKNRGWYRDCSTRVSEQCDAISDFKLGAECRDRVERQCYAR
jgi:hypothetical protein